MFTSLLTDDVDYLVFFSDYADRHYLKSFAKKYKGKRWQVTLESIFQELKRIASLQRTQQVDELKHGTDCKLYKYDFAIAQSGVSPKASGNRCIVFLDSKTHKQNILFVYCKNNLPKNTKETQYIYQVVEENFPELWSRLE